MQTKTIIGVLIAVVVVGGGVWYVTTQKGGSANLTDTTPQEEKAEGSGTLADLMMRTGSYKCTVTMNPTAANQQTDTAGTVYIGNGKLRGDFTTKVATMGNMSVESHMISSEGYVYTWSNLMPQGMKMKIDTSGEATTQTSIDASSAVDYHCAPWTTDTAQFTIPTNITFKAIGSAE